MPRVGNGAPPDDGPWNGKKSTYQHIKLLIPTHDYVYSGIAEEEDVRVDSLIDGEECWLSNGVRGFLFGKIRLS